MSIVIKFLIGLIEIFNEMSPYLLFGFFIAGVLHVVFPKDKISKYMGSKNARSVFNASILGVPLPLCSCGVIPTGISFYKNGASKGSTVSFLTSTPQTGVDSILITYSMLGLPFAIIRPIVALLTGLLSGIITNCVDKEQIQSEKLENVLEESTCSGSSCSCDHKVPEKNKNLFYRIFHYAFVEFLQDISKWLMLGVLIAGIITVIIPDNFFESYIGNEFVSMLIVLIASIPLYICATSSVPVAAALMMKGLSPGAALVFLMAGPATNAATMTMIGKVLGKKTLTVYLGAIIGGALFFGTLINVTLPREMFLFSQNKEMHHKMSSKNEHVSHSMLPDWLQSSSSILLLLLIFNGYIDRKRKSESFEEFVEDEMKSEKYMENVVIVVKGMTCNHCKMSVEKNIGEIPGIDNVLADLESTHVELEGEKIDLALVKECIKELGFEYEGKIKSMKDSAQ